MPIESIITQLAAVEATITGLSTARAFDNAPSSLDISPPFVVNFIDSGSLERSAGQGVRLTTHTIRCHLAVADQSSLAVAEKAARPYVNRFIAKLDQNKTLGGTVMTSEVTGYKYGEIKFNENGPSYLGVVFTLDALEEESVVFA